MSVTALRAGLAVRYEDPSQLDGIERGLFAAQPLWIARRAVVEADGRWHWSRRDLTPRELPRCEHAIRRCGLSLEVAVLRGGRMVVSDVIIARPFWERNALAARLGFDLHAHPLRGIAQVNRLLDAWSRRRDCRGALLKRVDASYPWLPRYERRVPEWVALRLPIAIGAGRQEG